MSEHGSFVTQYCDCGKCFEVVKKHLLAQGKFLCSQVITWQDDGLELPNEFWFDFGHKIAKEICHTVRIAVLSDNGHDEIFVIGPGDTEEVVLKKYSPPYNGEPEIQKMIPGPDKGAGKTS